jgi:predicted nucleic acid-binding protein
MTDNASFKETFKRLKQILVPYSEELVIVTDEDDNFYLNTHFTMKNKKPMYFGSVKVN